MVKIFKECCIRSGRVHVNPIFGLLLGISFYVLLPCSVIAYFGETLADLIVYTDELTLSNAIIVMAFTLALLIAFRLGIRWKKYFNSNSNSNSRVENREKTQLNLNGNIVMPTVVLFGSFVLFSVLTFSIRAFLFTGYDESTLGSDSMWSARGTMSSFYSLIAVSISAIILRKNGKLSFFMASSVALIFLFSSVILLSFGARLYVAMALLSFLALYSLLNNGLSATRLLTCLLSAMAVFGSIGVLRSGSLNGIVSVVLNIALEPILTSISLFTLISNNPMILIGKFYLFPADFQAILPSFLFPAKSELFSRLADYGFVFEAPVGGFHLYFSALINFGFLGSIILAVPCGYILGRLSNRRLMVKASTALSSIFLTGALTFTIFRDPFFISIVKNVVIMSIFMPKLLTSFTLYGKRKKRSRCQTKLIEAA
ncbi:MAG TPA: O-antigen polymerase [Rhodoferax sp.]